MATKRAPADPGMSLPMPGVSVFVAQTSTDASNVSTSRVDHQSDVRAAMRATALFMGCRGPAIEPEKHGALVMRCAHEASSLRPGEMVVETDYGARTAVEQEVGRYCVGFGKTPCGAAWFRASFVSRGELAFPRVWVHDGFGPRMANTRDRNDHELDDERVDGTR